MKVCVIYSGQTRSYNANHALWESHEKMATELKQRYDIEVDFIGHTWADQERPWNNSDFLHFGQSDQVCIDDWVKQDFFKRAWWSHTETFQEFVTECIDERKGNELVDKITYNSRQAYGQIFSFQKCISQINNDYDAYFKTRWDIMINKTNGFCEFFPYIIEEDKPFALFTGRAYLQTPKNLFLDDTNFILNKQAFGLYKDRDWLECLHENIVSETYNDPKPSSHKLWTQMHPDTITGRFVLQGDCFTITRTPTEMDMKKEKNKWAI